MRKPSSQLIKTILFVVPPYLLYFTLLSPYFNNIVSDLLLEFSHTNETTIVSSLNEYNDSSFYVAGTSTFDQLTYVEEDNNTSSTDFVFADPRVIAMRKFLADYNSPMYPYADVFVYEADKTGLDWRLVASISGVESGFGKVIPLNTNNAWGWKGGPNGTWSSFATWKEGISTVTNGLAYGYGTNLTPFQIEPTYCPPCGVESGHPWANGVMKYMNDLSYYLNNLENM